MAFTNDVLDNPVEPHSQWLTGSVGAILPRGLSVFFGFSLVTAGAGLWLFPAGAFWATLLQACVSFVFILTGAALMQLGTDKAVRELRFDARARQVLLVRRNSRGGAWILARLGYDDIAHIELSESELEMLDCYGRVLASVPLDGPHARLAAMAQLRSFLPHYA